MVFSLGIAEHQNSAWEWLNSSSCAGVCSAVSLSLAATEQTLGLCLGMQQAGCWCRFTLETPEKREGAELQKLSSLNTTIVCSPPHKYGYYSDAVRLMFWVSRCCYCEEQTQVWDLWIGLGPCLSPAELTQSQPFGRDTAVRLPAWMLSCTRRQQCLKSTDPFTRCSGWLAN